MVEAEMTLALPATVTVTATPGMPTPNEMRRLKAMTGRTMSDLMGEAAEEEDRLQAMTWLALIRQGHAPTWDDAGDVALDIQEEAAPDPSKNGS